MYDNSTYSDSSDCIFSKNIADEGGAIYLEHKSVYIK
jgi:predicted outer membrane repeat protein